MTAEAHCDCTGLPPWPTMMRLHAGGPHRYYLCCQCGAVREDLYKDGAIVEHRWHDAPDRRLPYAVREEALAVLRAPQGEQLRLWGRDFAVGPPRVTDESLDEHEGAGPPANRSSR